jgi:hypothetical protein
MSANQRPRISRASLPLSALFPAVFALVALPLQLVTFLSGQSYVLGYSLVCGVSEDGDEEEAEE